MYAGGPPGRAVNPTPAADIPAWTNSTREMILNRIEQDAIVPEAQEAFIAEALRWDAQSPNGFRRAGAEGRSPRPVPEQLTVPTLMVYGARDNAYDAEKAASFFARIANDDKALVVVPDSGHFLVLQKQRMRLFEAAARWFAA
jgi:pimeloyl-ACP methyl ester carboxylesterase